MFLKSQKAFLLALDPLRQISADLSKAKDVLALIQEIVLAKCSPFLMEISCASLEWYCKHSFPMPPVDVKIRGVKVPCSMSSSRKGASSRSHDCGISVGALGPYTNQH